MKITVRPAVAQDVPQILAFVRALARYEREPDAVEATEESLLRDGFGDRPYFHCLVAECDGRPAGISLYFFNYSTWVGRPGLYIEDIFVPEEFRGLGVGRALFEASARVAVQNRCGRLQWQVLDWNTPAIEFYRAMGGEFLDEWRTMRVEGERLEGLAEGRSPEPR